MIDCHVTPPSRVRNIYGCESSIRKRLTETYAVLSVKCDALICVTLLQAVIAAGVMFFQFLPWLRVTHTSPSSVPAHSVSIDLNEAATA